MALVDELAERVDVCLVAEGTYPFVRGGVSSWVHTLIRSLPHLSFSILHVSPEPGYYADECGYDLPANAVGVHEAFLFRPAPATAAGRRSRISKAAVAQFCAAAASVHGNRGLDVTALLPILPELRHNPFAVRDLLTSAPAWRTLSEHYRREAHDESFLDFFWNWTFVYQPMLNVMAAPLPPARLYHAVATGYAGLLATLAKREHAAPMMLTEHGLYAKERRIDIYAADWIRDRASTDVVPAAEAPYFRAFWIRQFQALSQLCYRNADRILTTNDANRDEQIRDGAPRQRVDVVSNGIDVEAFEETARRHDRRETDTCFTVGFAGRVAPIKDLRTLMVAARLVHDEVPDIRFRVMGSTSEDVEYASDCMAFAHDLGLRDRIHFEGPVHLPSELDKIDVLVLTSLSETQPLVILEAGAVGVPVVSTDVGCCRELLLGRDAEDRALGAGGIVTPIASPGATARAILELHNDPWRRRTMGRALRTRVQRYYDQRAMVSAYAATYRDMLQHDSQAVGQ